MPRPPAKLLGIAFGGLVLAHATLAARGFHELWWQPSEWRQNLVWLAASFGVVLVGRLFLAFLPPGPTGAHDGRGLAETWAASLALGWLALGLGGFPLARLSACIAVRESASARWIPYALALGLLALIGLARWFTLPGAMVPRHEQERESFGALRLPLVAVLLAWLVHALCTRAFVPALAWLALGVVLERALARARRAAGGRALFLLAFAVLGNPARAALADTYGMLAGLGLAAALGCGAAYLVPWLRRADKRAGLLAALFFGAPFLLDLDPLMLAGPLVLVLGSRKPQRVFALSAAATASLACAAVGLQNSWPGRGRLLLARELAAEALDSSTWGLAWPLAALALGVGALTFPWRGEPWQPGTIEVPRREVLALVALLVLSGLALSCSASRFFEADALLLLFPPLALLAGLLVIPPRQAAG